MSQSSPSRPPVVAAIVLNSVSHDVRVLKEAASLQGAGYDVTIIGIRDNRCDEPETLLPSGVRIERVAWRGRTYRLLARLVMLFGLIGLAAVILTFGVLAKPILRLLQAIVNSEVFPAFVAGAIIGVPAMIFLIRTHARIRQTAHRYEALDHASEANDAKGTATPLNGHTQSPLTRIRALMTYQGFIQPLGRMAGNFVRSREIVEHLRRIRPDVVHCHDLSALPIGAAFKRKNPVKLVYDSHEIFEEVSMMTPRRRARLERRQRSLSRTVDLFITINESIAEYLHRKYPALPPPVVVRNAARFQADAPPYDGRLHLAAELPRDARIVLYQGGFSKHRGLPILLEAAPLLPADWTLVMMGWGTIEPLLRAHAARLDPAGERIRFVPGAPVAELAQWTAGATIGIIPYENVCLNHWYCTPNKLWEYPVAGVPILASDFPELAKAIKGYGIGRLLPDPLTPQDIAQAISSLDDRSLSEMKAACARFIADDHWDRYAERLVEAYRSLNAADRRNAASPDAPSVVPSEEICDPAAFRSSAQPGTRFAHRLDEGLSIDMQSDDIAQSPRIAPASHPVPRR